ncbi:MFS transporter [Caldivirga maquilingensis]|uniref:Major facilitator superfamily MFS_1 n=1 Tax=Caldivirga maquilingensis (strain ATCC 700844 / DSM 13496 / JCM 10307 / IC-167) TaxID=397948 RepID=A8MD38_CALMQ|nr:MFS transporter [Caldivirga maquilingensis]ABW01694.1 major facilitator superfamily MFS_1 [Caldivirga maquilingensis IC-167]
MDRGFIIAWSVTFLQLTVRLGWGVVSVAVAELLRLSSVQIGLVLTLFYIGYVVSSIPWGVFIDKVGPGKSILISGTFSSIVILALFLAGNFTQILLLYLAAGFLTAGLFPSAMKIASYSTQERVHGRVALLESAAPIALIALSVASPLIITHWRIFYLVVFFALLIASLSSIGLKVSGSKDARPRKVLMNLRVAKAVVIRAGELWGTWGTSSWLLPFLILYNGINGMLSELFFFTYSLGQLVSIFLASVLPKLIGERRVIEISLIAFIICDLLAVTLIKVTLLFFPIFLVLGISSFLYRPPTDVLIIRIMGNENAGTSTGYANAVSQVGSMVAPIFVGIAISVRPVFGILSLALGPLVSLIILYML